MEWTDYNFVHSLGSDKQHSQLLTLTAKQEVPIYDSGVCYINGKVFIRYFL